MPVWLSELIDFSKNLIKNVGKRIATRLSPSKIFENITKRTLKRVISKVNPISSAKNELTDFANLFKNFKDSTEAIDLFLEDPEEFINRTGNEIIKIARQKVLHELGLNESDLIQPKKISYNDLSMDQQSLMWEYYRDLASPPIGVIGNFLQNEEVILDELLNEMSQLTMNDELLSLYRELGGRLPSDD